MKSIKRYLTAALAASMLVATVSGCAGSAPASSAAPSAAPASSTAGAASSTSTAPAKMEEFISLGTSSSGGTFNTLGVAISQLWNDSSSFNKKTQFSAEITGGSSENCLRLNIGEIQLAFSSAASAYEAYNGVGQFEGKKCDKIYVIGNLYPAIMQMPVLTSSGIKNLDDIAGKKINIGQAGSGSEAQTLSLLEVYDISLDSFTPQQLSHSNASDALIDEKLDGYINSGSLGQSHQMKAMSSGKVSLASFGPTEKIEKLISTYPYYYKYTIPAGSYPNQDSDVETVATGTLLMVNGDISEELVYQATKALVEGVEELAKTQQIASEIKLPSLLECSGIPLHPGAQRYYKEIGAIK